MNEELRDKYKIPAWCPLCQRIMKGKSTQTYIQHGVCVNCVINFVEGREVRWTSGWRPSQEEVDATYQD